VRAANVLYKEGAKGINDWTAKVNDAGYAAKQAAALQDNLSGDLEKLGGSFDTLMISLGSGAQGPLRELVQMLGGLVDGVTFVTSAVSSLPGPVGMAALAFGVWALAGDKISGVFGAVQGKMQGFRDELELQRALLAMQSSGLSDVDRALGGLGATAEGTGSKFGLARAAVGGFAKAIGPELGIAAATALVANYLGEVSEVNARMQAASDAGDSFRATLAEQKGALNDATRAAADMTVKAAGLADAFDHLGISSAQAARALSGNKADFDEILKSLEDMDRQALVTSGSWNELFGTGTRVAMDAVSGKATENADAFKKAAGAAGDYFLIVGNVDAGGWGRAVAGQGEAAAAATAQTEQATKALEDWLKQVQQISTDFVEPLSVYQDLLQQKQQAEQAAAEKTAATTKSSSDSWKDYVRDSTVSLDEWAKGLEQKLTDQANWQANIVTITQRGGYEVGQAFLAMGVDAASQTAQMANATDAEFQRMAGLIVKDTENGGAAAAAALDTKMKVMAAVGAAGGQATVQGIAAQLGIGVDVVAGIFTQYGQSIAGGINPILTSLGKPTVVGYHVAGLNGGPGGTQVKGAATGGYIAGPGTGTSDSIPARLSNGEFVVKASETARHRPLLEAMNSGELRFAGGGFVSAADVPKPYSTAPYSWAVGTPGDAAMQKEHDEAVAYINANAMGPGPTGPIGAGVQRWRALVLAALNLVHQPGSYADITLRRMNQESGGNPRAINLTDSNARKGTPSKGLMQVIDPTFRAYAMPGHNSDIWDPMSNVLASMRYAMARYGSLSAAYNKAGGYAAGGTTPVGDPFWVGEQGPELMWSSREKYVTSAAQSREFSGGSGGAGGGGGAISVNIEGAQIVGRLVIDGDGMARLD
jgi:hypothetical protein